MASTFTSKTPKTGPCFICKKHSTTRCAQCQDVLYCSKECQKKDWSIHKMICKQFAEIYKSTRPSPDHVLYILFPEEEVTPKLVWIPFVTTSTIDDDFFGAARFGHREVAPYIGPHDEQSSIVDNYVWKEPLRDILVIKYRAMWNDSKTNKSIARIRRGYSTFDWSGPVLAYGKVGDDRGAYPADDKDLTASDFRHLVEHFRRYRA